MGKAVSKQRLAHWIVEAIVLAYQARRLPCPRGLRAHSTRGVASSWALALGALTADICRASGWATPNTFERFYNLRESLCPPVYLPRMVSDTGTCSVSITLAVPLPSTDRICAFASQFSSPPANPVEVRTTPSAVRRCGALDARSSTLVFAQGQPLCWARCRCVLIPLQVIPHVYSSTVRLPSR